MFVLLDQLKKNVGFINLDIRFLRSIHIKNKINCLKSTGEKKNECCAMYFKSNISFSKEINVKLNYA